MKAAIAYSPFDSFIEKLRKKSYCEFKMTPVGFTSGGGKFYEPRELAIKKVYRFEDAGNFGDSSYIYLMSDTDGLEGYSIDASEDYEINEQNLYHWFITKVPGDKTIRQV